MEFEKGEMMKLITVQKVSENHIYIQMNKKTVFL